MSAPVQQTLVELQGRPLYSHHRMLARRFKRLIILRAPMHLLVVTSVACGSSPQREAAEAGSPRDDVGRVPADKGAVAVSPLSLQGCI
jgi:hypothetical protein